MRLLIAAILAVLLPFHYVIAQSSPPSNPPLALIKGSIADSLEKKNLSNGSVLLLQKADSFIVRHVRTDKGGNFELKDIKPGHYLLLVTYPSYADYADELEIKDSLPHTLHPIGMMLKSKLLEEVVVNGSKGAIRMKGDTIEFKADSFRTQAGASVEDLLKKLPGIQVDSKGKITAQGQTVQKVLVDGEEFFGDDPTLVTQNLRADMVDKVQVMYAGTVVEAGTVDEVFDLPRMPYTVGLLGSNPDPNLRRPSGAAWRSPHPPRQVRP